MKVALRTQQIIAEETSVPRCSILSVAPTTWRR